MKVNKPYYHFRKMFKELEKLHSTYFNWFYILIFLLSMSKAFNFPSFE